MPAVKQSVSSQSEKPPKPAKPKWELASELSVPKDRLDDYSYWFYGAPGIGKTTLANALFGKVHFFMFDDGAKAISVYKKEIREWPQFKSLSKQIWDKPTDYTGVCVDLVEGAYQMAFDYVLDTNGWEDPSEPGYGKGWRAIHDTFMTPTKRLMTIPGKGCCFISHSTQGERKTKDGDVVEDIHPNLSGKPMVALSGAVDLVGYYHYKRNRHVLQILGDDDVFAKNRIDGRFLYTDGTRIKYLDMGNDAEESAAALIAGFNNQLDPPPPPPPKETPKRTPPKK